MSNKVKRESALVQCVIALDNHLAELQRVGAKINSTDMSSDLDVEYIQKLVLRFAECGQAVSQEIAKLSSRLQEAQSTAEAVAQGVSRQAELLRSRRLEQGEKLERFAVLGEKVRELNAAISRFRPADWQPLTAEGRAEWVSSIPRFQLELDRLIGEVQDLRDAARTSRMRTLEKSAESLAQTLQAVRRKLADAGETAGPQR